MKNQIEENLFHYFVGYTRNNQHVEALLQTDDWKQQAQEEINRRKIHILKGLPLDELEAIVNGDINMNDIIQRAADNHR